MVLMISQVSEDGCLWEEVKRKANPRMAGVCALLMHFMFLHYLWTKMDWSFAACISGERIIVSELNI